MMEKKWIREDFGYNEDTASWYLKHDWLLADYPVKFEIRAAAFEHDTMDWAVVNEFMTYQQKSQERIKDDILRIHAIINALADANSAPVLHADRLQLGEIVLKRYAGNGYRFTYDYLFTAGIPDKIFHWTATLKDSSITGVAKS